MLNVTSVQHYTNNFTEFESLTFSLQKITFSWNPKKFEVFTPLIYKLFFHVMKIFLCSGLLLRRQNNL